jgi:hypothetical protein
MRAQFGAGVEVEFGVDVCQVRFDGGLGDEHSLADLWGW